MGRKPDPNLAQLKAQIRMWLDEALELEWGLVLHADADEKTLRIIKQVKKEEERWKILTAKTGQEAGEIWIEKKQLKD